MTAETLFYCWKRGNDYKFVRLNSASVLTFFFARVPRLPDACEKYVLENLEAVVASAAFRDNPLFTSMVAVLAGKNIASKRVREEDILPVTQKKAKK